MRLVRQPNGVGIDQDLRRDTSRPSASTKLTMTCDGRQVDNGHVLQPIVVRACTRGDTTVMPGTVSHMVPTLHAFRTVLETSMETFAMKKELKKISPSNGELHENG